MSDMLDKDRIRLMTKMSIYEKITKMILKLPIITEKIMQVLRHGLH